MKTGNLLYSFIGVVIWYFIGSPARPLGKLLSIGPVAVRFIWESFTGPRKGNKAIIKEKRDLSRLENQKRRFGTVRSLNDWISLSARNFPASIPEVFPLPSDITGNYSMIFLFRQYQNFGSWFCLPICLILSVRFIEFRPILYIILCEPKTFSKYSIVTAPLRNVTDRLLSPLKYAI